MLRGVEWATAHKITEIAANPEAVAQTKYAKFAWFCVQMRTMADGLGPSIDPGNVRYFVQAKDGHTVEVEVTKLVCEAVRLVVGSISGLVADDLKFADDLAHGYNGRA